MGRMRALPHWGTDALFSVWWRHLSLPWGFFSGRMLHWPLKMKSICIKVCACSHMNKQRFHSPCIPGRWACSDFSSGLGTMWFSCKIFEVCAPRLAPMFWPIKLSLFGKREMLCLRRRKVPAEILLLCGCDRRQSDVQCYKSKQVHGCSLSQRAGSLWLHI